MNLTETEEDILDELYAQFQDDQHGDYVLQPARSRETEFEKGLKRLDLGGFIEIEERFGDNKAILHLTPRGRKLCERRAGDIEVRTRTVVLDEVETWEEPPTHLEDEFVRYDELESGDRFEDKKGHEWEVPKQADNPDAAQRILNRTAIDFRRGTSAVVPEETWVRKTDT